MSKAFGGRRPGASVLVDADADGVDLLQRKQFTRFLLIDLAMTVQGAFH